MALTYSYGLATIHFRLFPYEQLRFVYKSLSGTAPDKSAHYLHRVSMFEKYGRNNYDIVFIGDSITESAEWQDIFPDVQVANRGIDGDTAEGINNRMASILATNVNKAFIMVGINDFSRGYPVDSVFSSYRMIIDKLVNEGILVYVQSTIPAGARLFTINSEIKALNRRLEALAAESPDVTYIDIASDLAPNGLLESRYSEDGVHLNAAGYSIWQKRIKQYL